MANLLTANFVGSAGTALEALTGWSKHPNYLTGAAVLTNANRARGNSAATAIYLNAWSVPSADYRVGVSFLIHSEANLFLGVAARWNATASTGYTLQYNTTNKSFELNKRVAGTKTVLVSNYIPSPLFVVDTTHTIALDVAGTTITGYIDGVAIAGLTVTDSSISDAGQAGLLFAGAGTDTTGPQANSFTIDGEVVTASSYTAAATMPWGPTGKASLAITLTPDASYTGTITPDDGGDGGTFTPASLTWSGEATGKTLTYTPASAGDKSLGFTADPALTDPAPLTYTAVNIPSEANTGPSGALTPSGSVSTTSAGQTIANLDITGHVEILHDNVTVNNCRINTGGGSTYCIAGNNHTGTEVTNSDLTGGAASGLTTRGAVRYCRIHDMPEDCIEAQSGAVIEYNLIERMGQEVGSHGDGVQMQVGSGVTIQYNVIRGSNGACSITTDAGTIDDVTINRNWLDSVGSYIVYARDGTAGYGAPTNVRITDNYFGASRSVGDITYNGSQTITGNVDLTSAQWDAWVVPTAPTALTATAAGPDTINLGWTDNSSNETGFELDFATDAGFSDVVTLPIDADATSYAHTGLNADTTYYYRIRAVNAAGNSANSATANATTTAAPAEPTSGPPRERLRMRGFVAGALRYRR